MYTGVLSMGVAAEYQKKKKENDEKAEALEKIKKEKIQEIIKKLRFDARQIKIKNINKRNCF